MTTDPIVRLGEVGPGPGELTDADLEPARRRFTELTGIAVDPRERRPVAAPPAPARGGGRRWWLAVAAAAVAVAVVGFAFESRDPSARTTTSSPGSAPVRTWAGLIDLVAAQPDESGHPGLQYQRWEAINRAAVGATADGKPNWATNPYLAERWIDADGRGGDASSDVLGPRQTLPARSEVARLQPDAPYAMALGDIRGVSRDPAVLRQQLRQRFASTGGDEIQHDQAGVYLALELLTQPATPPDLRAAILQLLATDRTFTESAPPGAGIITGEITLVDTRHVIDIDTATGRVRAWHELAAADDPTQGLTAGDPKAYRKDLYDAFVVEPGQRP